MNKALPVTLAGALLHTTAPSTTYRTEKCVAKGRPAGSGTRAVLKGVSVLR